MSCCNPITRPEDCPIQAPSGFATLGDQANSQTIIQTTSNWSAPAWQDQFQIMYSRLPPGVGTCSTLLNNTSSDSEYQTADSAYQTK